MYNVDTALNMTPSGWLGRKTSTQNNVDEKFAGQEQSVNWP